MFPLRKEYNITQRESQENLPIIFFGYMTIMKKNPFRETSEANLFRQEQLFQSPEIKGRKRKRHSGGPVVI